MYMIVDNFSLQVLVCQGEKKGVQSVATAVSSVVPTLSCFKAVMVEMVSMEEMGVMECLVVKYHQDLQGNLAGPAGGPPGTGGAPGPQGAVGPAGPRSGGVTYTRWGKSSCPNVAGTELVYTGRAGGSHSLEDTGGGVNFQCMPLDPQYTLSTQSGVIGHTYIYGTEYNLPLQGSHRHNVPCAVCYVSTRETVLMIPAKTSCPTSSAGSGTFAYCL